MRPRILLVAVSDWFGASRLPRMLKRAGFEVGLLADPNTLIAQSRHIDYRFDLDVVTLRLGVIGPALQAIMGFNPRTIIPCDEAAAHLLQNFALSWDGARGPGGQLRVAMPPLVRELLLRALGEARMAAMGNLPAAAPKVFEETTVALFPQDWMRDPESSARGTDYEDMPEEDERLLASLRLRIPRRGAVSP